MDFTPRRIVCLTDEVTETLYVLGEEDRIVGISGFTSRPPRARKEKPKISTFTEARTEEILALKPDMVIGFSDVQAEMARELIAKGLTVWINNYRSVRGILNMIGQLGALVGQEAKAHALIQSFEDQLAGIKQAVARWEKRPRVYFEEWDEPLITGIEWVAELIDHAGGEDIFPEHRHRSLAKDRTISDPNEVIARQPDIILASWCGKKFKKERLIQRPGWASIPALAGDQVFEIDSSIILQPGPAALLEGLPALHGIFKKWVERHG